LDRNGREQLRVAESEFRLAIVALGSLNPTDLDVYPIESEDDEARLEQHWALKALWAGRRRRIGRTKIAAAEPHIRSAEQAAVRALNFLEDHPLGEAAHEVVHRTAQLRRGLLGCPIEFRDDVCWTTCPFSLAHIRVGFSAGITGSFVCSVCERPMEDCDHLPGTTYDHVKRGGGGSCNVCHATSCEHDDGETYAATVTPIGVAFSAHEASMVPRPMYPQARFGEIEVTDDLDSAARALAQEGRLHCDECLGPCEGLLDARAWGERVGLPIA
jgi:hypothetical protein